MVADTLVSMALELEPVSLVVAEIMDPDIDVCLLSERRGREDVEAVEAALVGEAFGAESAAGVCDTSEGECRALNLGRRIFRVGVASVLCSPAVAEVA